MGYFFSEDYDPHYLHALGSDSYKIRRTDDHRYFVEKSRVEIEYPCVSKIIETVFGNPFRKVSAAVLAKAAKKGSIVHEEICDFIITGKRGCTREFFSAESEIIRRQILLSEKIAPEQMLFADNPFMPFCCTIDAFFFSSGLIVDYKTGSKLDIKNVTRQLNLYAYALRKNGYRVSSLEAWHLRDGQFNSKSIVLYDDYYCECILRAYEMCKTFKDDNEMLEYFKEQDGFKEEKKEKSSISDYCDKVRDIDFMIEKLKSTREVLANKIQEEMERTNTECYGLRDTGMTVTYIPESERKAIDTKLIKEKNESLYEGLMRDFAKVSKVKAHIRIKYS